MQPTNLRRIDQINEMWKADAKYKSDPLSIAEEGSHNISLHAKYQGFKSEETRKLAELKLGVEILRFKLLRFYRDGSLTPQEMQYAEQAGWEKPPGGKPVLKTDVKFWVESNSELIGLMLQLSDQNDIVELLDDIIKMIHSRGYNVNATIEIVKHINGVG